MNVYIICITLCAQSDYSQPLKRKPHQYPCQHINSLPLLTHILHSQQHRCHLLLGYKPNGTRGHCELFLYSCMHRCSRALPAMAAAMLYQYFLVLTFMYAINSTVILKPSVGVGFVEQPTTLRPWAGSQRLTFVVKLPRLKRYDNLRLPVTTCLPKDAIFDAMCSEGKAELKTLIDISNDLVSQVNTELQNLKKLLRGLVSTDVNKRSLINAGSFFQSLVGTASLDTVNALYDKIKQIHSDVSAAADDRQSLFETMNTMQQDAYSKFDSVFHLINDTDTFLSAAVRNLTTTNMKLDAVYSILTSPNSFTQLHTLHLQHTAVLSKHGYLRELLKTYQEFHKDMYVLLAGKLPVSMIPAADLLSGLAKLRKTFSKGNSKLTPLDDPSSLYIYYQEATFAHANVIDDSIVISLQIPFVANDKIYDAYKVVVKEIPVHSSKQHAQGAFSILTNAADYLVVDKTRETYKLMSTDEYNECAHFSFGLCKTLTVTTPRLKESCLWSIYKDDEANIIKLCDFRTYLQAQMETDILPVEPNQYLVSNVVGVISLSCENGVHYLTASNLSLVTTTCNCVWNTKDFIVNPRISECTSDLKEPSIKHPVSFPIMHAFNLTKHLSVPRTVALANDTPSVPIPDFDILADKMDSFMISVGITTSELPNALEKVKLHKVNPWTNIEIDSSLYPSHTWMFIGLAIWNSILSIVVIILCCRFKTVLPLLVSAPTKTTALNIPTPISSISHVDNRLADNNELLTITCILICLTAVIILIHRLLRIIDTCHWRVNNFNRHFPMCIMPDTLNQNLSIYARMSITCKNHVVFLATVGVQPEMTFISVPKCISFGLYVEYCTPKLVFEWDGQLISQDKGQSNEIHLPTCVSITWPMYQKIATVIKTTTTLDPTDITLVYQSRPDSDFQLIVPMNVNVNVTSDNVLSSSISMPDIMDPSAHLI